MTEFISFSPFPSRAMMMSVYEFAFVVGEDSAISLVFRSACSGSMTAANVFGQAKAASSYMCASGCDPRPPCGMVPSVASA
jgi:hypothetical protein